mmetsp:Transcript_15403/g.19245  ORF Transcript_15403/g.19245 Transcript_15403/m.19245 type:complete len:92 (+) Transcript_15403:179-454(+)
MPVWESHRPGVVRFSNEEPITRGPVLGAVVETSRSPSSYQPSYPTESPNSKILRLETDALAIGSDSNAGVNAHGDGLGVVFVVEVQELHDD